MAILTKGIFGPISGKLGNLVFCICVNGTNYVRTIPNKTKKPPTEAQIAQRKRFSIAAKFLHPLKEIVNKGFAKAKTKKGATPHGMAMGAMLKSGIIGAAPDYRIDFPRIQLSTGNLQHLCDLKVKKMGRDLIMLEWVSLTNRFNAFADDTVKLIVYNATQDLFVIEEIGQRKDEVGVLKMKRASSNDRLVLYAFMESEIGETSAQFISADI